MMCLELSNLHPDSWHQVVINTIRCQWTTHKAYQVHTAAAGAFLQGEHTTETGVHDWTYVEFWRPEGIAEFVQYVNECIDRL